MAVETGASEKKTHLAFIWTNVLKAPFWTLYLMLVYILYKEVHATPLQIAVFMSLKPAGSLFSIYWGSFIHRRPDRLRSNVILADLISYIPFFFFPFIQNSWFIVISCALFLMMKRATTPAWMEILKLNLPQAKRGHTFSYGSALSHLGSAILPIFFAKWMDMQPGAWRFLLPLTALLGLGGMILQWRIPIHKKPEAEMLPVSANFKSFWLKPWKNAWHIYRTRPDFVRYQIGFMILGGGALMIMAPALPAFFMDSLQMSYTGLAVALGVCQGIGFALTSRVWSNWMNRFSIYRFSALVTLIAALFPIGLLLAQANPIWIYVAYAIYGVMQAGSELSWHLSGPIFAKEEDSTAYSSVNLLIIGLRGLFLPALGTFICGYFGAPWVLLLGGILCTLASCQLILAQGRSPVVQEKL